MTSFKRRPGGWDDLPGSEYAAGLKTYHAFLDTRDFSSAGDLLPYFGHDLFHDGAIDITTPDGEARTELRVNAYVDVEGDESEIDVPFLVDLTGVVWLSVEYDKPQNFGLQCYGYAEIDGLDDRIAQAEAQGGGTFHSLVIECPGGVASFVFRTARVAPVDALLWTSAVRRAQGGLAIYGMVTR